MNKFAKKILCPVACLTIILTSNSMKADQVSNSKKLSKILESANVLPSGHREYQEATVFCSEYRYLVEVNGNMEEEIKNNCYIVNLTNDPVTGATIKDDFAKQLSTLLIEFGVLQKYNNQYAKVICNVPKDGVSGEPQCTVTNTDSLLSAALVKAKIPLKDIQKAHVFCRIAEAGVNCSIENKTNDNSTAEKISGSDAVDLSVVLEAAGAIAHLGRFQEADVVCKISKDSILGEPECEVTNLAGCF